MENSNLRYTFKFTRGFSINAKASVNSNETKELLKAQFPGETTEAIELYRAELAKRGLSFSFKNWEALPSERIIDAVLKSIKIDVQSDYRARYTDAEIVKMHEVGEVIPIDLVEFFATKKSAAKSAVDKSMTQADKIDNLDEINELLKRVEAKKAALLTKDTSIDPETSEEQNK